MDGVWHAHREPFSELRVRQLMMDGMLPGMMWAMLLIRLLVVVVLSLSAAALIKYLLSGRRRDRP